VIIMKADTQAKFISKYNLGDTVRHVADIGEKGIIIAVRFSMGSIAPSYEVATGTRDVYWFEGECIRFIMTGL
jgi:fibrillarin-like rRNA methylase